MIKTIFEHRSVRNYTSQPVDLALLQQILEAGVRASNTGNMQLYSMVVTTDRAIRTRLAPCHFNQPMVTEAPVVITFCVDVRRFSLWCRARGAEPRYDNFLWFVSGMTDTILAAQNVTLAAESEGLGVCYLGTVLYSAERIVEILQLPEGVLPVATLTMGYPATMPPLTDRLPLDGVIHWQQYHDYSPEAIDAIWAEKEASEETKELLKVNELPNLARIFTERRYTASDNLSISRAYFETLKKQGFFNQ